MSIRGSQKIAILLCKFRDSANIEPQPAAFYQDLFVNRATGGLNDYWIAATFGAVDLDGSHVFGWKTLDLTGMEYLVAHPGRWDKIQGAINAFDIDPSQFKAVVALFNVSVGDGGADGGPGGRVGVLAQPTDANVTFLAHELGHNFGLDHSFDTSARIAVPAWPSAPGEYFDPRDLMSAMSVGSDSDHRFSPRGPLLNAANLDHMGWLPSARVWRPPARNSSSVYEFDIVALEHPDVTGYLAAEAEGWIAEFRIPSGFDSGLPRPTVLFHKGKTGPNSVIYASDDVNYNHEWQPGQVFGNSRFFDELGGARVTVVSFDLHKKTARLRVQVKAVRPPFIDPKIGHGLGIGHLPWHGHIVVIKDGRIVPIPVPDPEPADLRAMIRSQVFQVLYEAS